MLKPQNIKSGKKPTISVIFEYFKNDTQKLIIGLFSFIVKWIIKLQSTYFQ